MKKMRNLGNYNYDYAHSLFGEVFLIQCGILVSIVTEELP